MRIPHGVSVQGLRVPRPIAAGIGAFVQAAEVMSELGVESARALLNRRRAVVTRAERGYRDAVDKGDLALGEAAAEASRMLTRTADDAAEWLDRAVVRRLTDAMVPYLIEELVPEVIDGVLPKIRSDVIPLVIEDLAGDERVRAMVAQQSQDVLASGVSEVRRACADGDDRVETALHRVLGRRDTPR